MITERAFVAVGRIFERRQAQAVCLHVVEAAVHEVRMAGDEAIIARDLGCPRERRAEALVQLRDLLEGEVLEFEARADVEGRLVRVGDKEMRLGRIDDGQRHPLPR